MLDPKLIRQDVDAVANALKKRGVGFDTSRFNSLEEQRKSLQVKLQDLQNERNVRSKAVGIAKSKGENADQIMQEVKNLSEDLNATQIKFEEIQTELHDFLALIPNLPHESVPIGKSEEDNQVVRTWGTPKKFSFTPKDHVNRFSLWIFFK